VLCFAYGKKHSEPSVPLCGTLSRKGLRPLTRWYTPCFAMKHKHAQRLENVPRTASGRAITAAWVNRSHASKRPSLNIRLPESSLSRLNDLARDAGVSRARIVELLLAGYAPSPEVSQTLREMLIQLIGFATNMNQLARHANTSGEIHEQALHQTLSECRSLIRQIQQVLP